MGCARKRWMLHHFLVCRLSVLRSGSKVCYLGRCFVWLPRDPRVYENTAKGRDLSWDLQANSVPTRAPLNHLFPLLISVKPLSLPPVSPFTFWCLFSTPVYSNFYPLSGFICLFSSDSYPYLPSLFFLKYSLCSQSPIYLIHLSLLLFKYQWIKWYVPS